MSNCTLCSTKLKFTNTPSFSGGKLSDGGVICTHCFKKVNKLNPDFAFKLKRHSTSEIKNLFREKEESDKRKEIELKKKNETIDPVLNEEQHINTNQTMKEIIVTTTDLKREYEILGPIYFQVSNKGIFSSALSRYIKKHKKKIEDLKKQGQADTNHEMDWGILYGEFSFGMENDFDKAFFVAVRELQLRAERIGADAIIGMKQDIDMDTNHFQNFYLQMYGTAVKFK